MGKNSNHIILSGKFVQILRSGVTTTRGGLTIPLVEGLVDTDLPALGGRHYCVFYGRQALKVRAYQQAAAGLLDVKVDGWLRSDGQVTVVADQVSFYCDETTRRKANVALATFEAAAPLSAKGPASG
jgi:hypothetical protein